MNKKWMILLAVIAVILPIAVIVYADTKIDGTFNVTGNTDLDGTLTVDGASTLTGAQTFTGAATFNGAVVMNSTAIDIKDMPLFAGVAGTATAKTADYSITTGDTGGVFTNVGDTVGQTCAFTLAAVAAGYTWTVANLVVGCTVTVDCDGSDLIVGLTDSAGNKIQSISAPAWVSFVALDATNIAVIQRYGTWTDAN